MSDILISLLIVLLWKNMDVMSLNISLFPDMDTYIEKQHKISGKETVLLLGSTADSYHSRVLLYYDLNKVKADIYSHFNISDQEIFSRKLKVDNAILTLHCVNFHFSTSYKYKDWKHYAFRNSYRSHNEKVSGNDINTNFRVYRSSLLKSWHEYQVTWKTRNKSNNWTKPYIDTSGVDAKYPENFIDVLFKKNQSDCKNVQLEFEVIRDVRNWFDKQSSNHGILLWTDNQELNNVMIGLQSRESQAQQLSPVLHLTISERTRNECLADQPVKCYLLEKPKKETCLPVTKVCNFQKDCVGGEDEHDCGHACDFEADRSCQGWKTKNASDGKPGFTVSGGKENSTPREDASGNEKGHYLLFENIEHIPRVTAVVISPWYGSSGPQCSLHFYVNMYGRSLGELQLLLLTDNQSGVIWSCKEQLGIKWTEFEVSIGQIKEPFTFVFKVTRGSGDEGYIAIDNVTLPGCDQDAPEREPCSLQEFRCGTGVCVPRAVVCDLKKDCNPGGEDEDPALCSQLPDNAVCTFESGLCGWFNFTSPHSNYYPWNRHHGSTPTDRTGPSVDHTYNSEEGYYLYMESDGMKILGVAKVGSPQFDPPPPQTYNKSSPYYQSCQLRFFYHMYGHHIDSMSVSLLEIVPGCDRCNAVRSVYFGTDLNHCTSCNKLHKAIWKESKLRSGVDKWIPVRIPLPEIHHRMFMFNLSTTFRFIIIVEGKPGIRSIRSDIGLDDVSLTLECFNKGILQGVGPSSLSQHKVNLNSRFAFKSCGATGRKGPTQFECDATYKTTEVKVKVLQNPPFAGIQVWTVPKTTSYSITALGANGGTGVQNPKSSKGGYAHAVFNFTEGEEIYLLIGQQGSSACSQTNKQNKKAKKICSQGFDESDDMIIGGGGGGGGGSYVFKKIPNSTELIPLIVAGGGGGKSYHLGHDPIKAEGGLSSDATGLGAVTPQDGPGGGGGWTDEGRVPYNQSGRSLLEGALGGRPCPNVMELFNWETSGGFGGGGGGCSAGGGGGGYTGGNVSRKDDLEHNGQGGSSYIHPDGDKTRLEPGSHNYPNGEVEIAFVVMCPCEFMCIYKNYKNKEYKCYCSPNFVLAEDGHSCYDPRKMPKVSPAEQMSTGAIVGIIVGSLVILVVLILVYYGYCVVSQRRKSQQAGRLEQLSIPDYQLDRLRSTNTATTMMTEYNPHYDFGDSQYTVQDLKEIPRDNLSLIKALGQGAFGEVYQGYLTGVSLDPPEVPVAVKTLPALCTDQAEMDFLMEALIMSKFNHPNIVRFIGVCFEKHPRYIVLELLVGGDLKTFLRESRPKPSQPSAVTMISLVKLALDVAKGCQYLEENHFIHRDIAARNCLLTTKNVNRVAKIADFGMARDIYRADYYKKGGKAMLPVKWMPPEAFLDGIFTSKTDVWSFGILLWEVFSMGYMPYPGRGNQEVMQLVTAGGRLESPQNCPAPVYHIMNLCWHGIPERRPNFATIIEKLQQCLQDPDVIHSPLPVFHRPPSAERDTTVVHPPDPSRMAVLSVTKKEPYLEPDTPNSLQPLIGPQSPDYDLFLDEAEAESARQPLEDQQQQQAQKRGPGGYGNSGHRSLFGSDNDGQQGSKFGNVFTYDSFGNSGSETQGLLSKDLKPPTTTSLSHNNNSRNALDKHIEENMLNESLDDICSTRPGIMSNSDSGRSSNSQFSSESISDSSDTNNKYLQPAKPTSLAPQLDLLKHNSSNINSSSHNKPNVKDSRSLSNSPWLSRNNNNTDEPRRPLYENMHLDPSRKHSGGHRSMSALPHHNNVPPQQQHPQNNNHSNSLVNIPESRSDPGDSGVVIDISRSARS